METLCKLGLKARIAHTKKLVLYIIHYYYILFDINYIMYYMQSADRWRDRDVILTQWRCAAMVRETVSRSQDTLANPSLFNTAPDMFKMLFYDWLFHLLFIKSYLFAMNFHWARAVHWVQSKYRAERPWPTWMVCRDESSCCKTCGTN